MHRGIAGSEFVVVPDSSHMTYAEQPEQVMSLVGGFLEKVEAGAAV